MKTNPTLLQTILLVTLLWMRPAAVEAQFTYATNNGTITIMQYTGSGGAVTVPNMTNGLLVTSITNNAFMDTGVASVTIPNSVTNIGAEAFSDCGSLTNALIGSSVQSIGRNAFMDCVHLKGVYFLGNAPGSIGSQLFGGGVSATAYYLPSTAGWGSMFAGIPAVPWNTLPVVGITTYNSQPVLFFPCRHRQSSAQIMPSK